MKWAWVLACALSAACGGDVGTVVTPSPVPSLPAPTRLVSGVVVSVGGEPIAGARVEGEPPAAPFATVTTGQDGAFSFDYPVGARFARAWARADGHEPRLFGWPFGGGPATVRVVMQPTITLAPGETKTVLLTADDLAYYVGEEYGSDYCGPCKLLRLEGRPGQPVTTVRARWSGANPVWMWAADESRAAVDGQQLLVRTIGYVYVGLPRTPTEQPHLSSPLSVTVSVD